MCTNARGSFFFFFVLTASIIYYIHYDGCIHILYVYLYIYIRTYTLPVADYARMFSACCPIPIYAYHFFCQHFFFSFLSRSRLYERISLGMVFFLNLFFVGIIVLLFRTCIVITNNVFSRK